MGLSWINTWILSLNLLSLDLGCKQSYSWFGSFVAYNSMWYWLRSAFWSDWLWVSIFCRQYHQSFWCRLTALNPNSRPLQLKTHRSWLQRLSKVRLRQAESAAVNVPSAADPAMHCWKSFACLLTWELTYYMVRSHEAGGYLAPLSKQRIRTNRSPQKMHSAYRYAWIWETTVCGVWTKTRSAWPGNIQTQGWVYWGSRSIFLR